MEKNRKLADPSESGGVGLKSILKNRDVQKTEEVIEGKGHAQRVDSLKTLSKSNISKPMFELFPSKIVYKNFVPAETYKSSLILKNNDMIPRQVKVTQKAVSPYFQLIPPRGAGHHIAPGLQKVYKIHFTPSEKKDYFHELVCTTDSETFIVPIKAIGPRAELDFPDEIHFPICTVKNTNTKTLLVQNSGTREAVFTLDIDRPFSVTPERGRLKVEDRMQVTISFTPQQSRDFKTNLILRHDTGEEILIPVYGAAQDSNVRLDKNSIRFENTYITASNQRTITIQNRSNVIAYYRWTQFATREEEEQQKLLQKMKVNSEEKDELAAFLPDYNTDQTVRHKKAILERNYQMMRHNVEKDNLLFDDDVVTLEPLQGEIWPNSTSDIHIKFRPRQPQQYSCTAYCDITGRESRLPLTIRGTGQGPIVEASYQTLEMGSIFIGSVHKYEMTLANRGDLDAIYKLLPRMSIFGPCFQFVPAEGVIEPGGFQAMSISFYSQNLGDFSEEFSIQIDGAPEPVKITFIGTVIGPTFQFNLSSMEFGTVSFGFVNTQNCTLFNTSLVPMSFHLRIPSDGDIPSLCCMNNLTLEEVRQSLQNTKSVKEFEVIADSDQLQPLSKVKIRVNFISNSVKKYDIPLVVDMDNIGQEVLSLNITAKCVVPTITVLTPVLDYGRCFLRYPHEMNIQLRNASDLPAKYEMIRQEERNIENPPLIYYTSKPEGIIEPECDIEIPLFIEAQVLDKNKMTVLIDIFGKSEPLSVTVVFIGEGPVVNCRPTKLDWGVVTVLQDITKKISLSNEALIPARFEITLFNPNSVFRAEPSEGVIPPLKTLEISVIANLDDSLNFQNTLQIDVIESYSQTVPLKAAGHGSTIISDPPLTSRLDLGYHFSNRLIRRVFTLTNKGRRQQYLQWVTEGFQISKQKRKMHSFNTQDIKNKNVPPPPKPSYPIFNLLPNHMDLLPGQSTEMTLEGMVESPQFIHERLLCYSVVGKQNEKDLIMKIDLLANCICPLVEFSTKCVYFRVDMYGGETIDLLTKELTLSNLSFLPLSAELSLHKPFQFILEDGSETSEVEVELDVGKSVCLKIQFDHLIYGEFNLQTITELLYIRYAEHQHVDSVTLRGEVYFPNIELEKQVVDFGCIINDTEVTRYVNMTNTSPMVVHYKWSFVIDSDHSVVVSHPPVKSSLGEEVPEVLEQAETETDELEFTLHKSDEMYETHSQEVEEDKRRGSNRGDNVVSFLQDIGSHSNNREITSVDMEKGQLDVEQETTTKDDTTEETLEEEQEEEEDLVYDEMMEWNLIQLSAEEEALKSNKVLSSLLENRRQRATPIGIEQVFDIMPLYGVLEPEQNDQLTLTFFGHTDIRAEVKCVCKIEGGPTYELRMKGEASSIEYSFNIKQINFGQQIYDQVVSSDIVLTNKGKIGFHFITINTDPALAKNPPPGMPIMVPPSGFIEPGEEMTLTVKFIFGTPEKFHKIFLIQVAHFEPDIIHLFGEGLFPRISLDLPRLIDEEGGYYNLLEKAMESMIKQEELKESKIKELGVQRSVTMRKNTASKLVQTWFPHLQVQAKEQDTKELQTSDSLMRSSLSKEAQTSESLTKPLDNKDTQTTDSLLTMSAIKLPSRGKSSLKTTSIRECHMKTFVSKEIQAPESMADVFQNKECQTTETWIKRLPRAVSGQATQMGLKIGDASSDHIKYVGSFKSAETPLDRKVELEAERLTVVEQELKQQQEQLSPDLARPSAERFDASSEQITLEPKRSKRKLKQRPVLPEYVLDFGHVILGTVQLQVVTATNTGMLPVCFQVERKNINKYGFDVQLDKVKNLPGYPDCESVDFVISFDPKSANLPLGAIQKPVLINIENGPSVSVVLKANVTMPTMQLSDEELYFDEVQCGECKIISVQLYNYRPIPCEWSAEKERRAGNRRVLRKGLCEKSRPPNFEVFPSTGSLLPGEKSNIQIRFIPSEEKQYDQKLVFRMAQSTEKQIIRCYGQGLEPRLEFLENYIEFSPILPHSSSDEKEIIVKNPCSFPVEFYCIELDKFYVEEERVLKTVRCYDKYNTLLLPIREPGDKLPSELIEHYEEQLKKGEVDEEDIIDVLNPLDDAESPTEEKDDKQSPLTAEELDISPVAAIIASNLGMDINNDIKATVNRRGIVVIVHGPHKSGKTSTAQKLAEKYNAAMLTIDGVIMDAVSKGQSVPARKLWTQYLEFVRKRDEEAKEAEEQEMKKPHQKSKHHGKNGNKTKKALHQKKKGLKDKVVEEIIVPKVTTNSSTLSTMISQQLAGWIVPQDLLEEILIERTARADCEWGVVFDGLNTIFSHNALTAVNAILKAFGSRRFIFYIPLTLDPEIPEDRLKLDLEEKEMERLRQEDEEREELEAMSETEYDALTEEQKQSVDERLLHLRKLKRIRDQREEKKRQELKRQEELELELQREKERENHLRRKKAKKLEKVLEKPEKSERLTKERKSLKSDVLLQSLGNSQEDILKSELHAEDIKKKRSALRFGKQSREAVEAPAEPVKDINLQVLELMEGYQRTQNELFYLLEHWDRTTQSFQNSESAPGKPGTKKKNKDEENIEKQNKEKEKLKADRYTKEVLESLGSELPIPPPLQFTVIPYPVERDEPPTRPFGGQYILSSSSQDEMGGDDKYKEDDDERYGADLSPSKDRSKSSQKSKQKSEKTRAPNLKLGDRQSVKFKIPQLLTRQQTRTDCIVAEDGVTAADSRTSKTQDENADDEKSETPDKHTKTKAKDRNSTESTGKKMEPIHLKGHRGHSSKGQQKHVEPEEPENLFYRWILPAKGEITLHVRFVAEELGQYDQHFTFEVVGNRKQYNMHCHGTCAFPTIETDPSIVFSDVKKSRKEGEILSKKYILKTKTFEFGPLLAAKSREKYREGNFPENIHKLNIINTSPIDAEISFYFVQDEQGDTFLVEPAQLLVKSGQKETITIWAYPKNNGRYTDTLVCKVLHSPVTNNFNVACDAFKPTLELDKKQFNFDKVLLHRKETRSIVMKNNTMLPVGWKIDGLELLGDDFSVAAVKGVIPPLSEYILFAFFQATKAAILSKKYIKLLVYDSENILGLIEQEQISIYAEAYDVCLDMHFLKGSNCGFEFGTLHVFDEQKQSCTIKNRGKYQIGFNFVIENVDPSAPDVIGLFTVNPVKGTLNPADRPLNIHVLFKAQKEIYIKDQPIVRCHVIDPTLGLQGEIIANIPVKVSVNAVFSKFRITPMNEINFGCVVAGCRTVRQFSIENKGEFEFKYSIIKKEDQSHVQSIVSALPPGTETKTSSLLSIGGMFPNRPSTLSRADQGGAGSTHFRVVQGTFVMSPASGTVFPNSSAVVVVECVSEWQTGIFREEILLDITHRNPWLYPNGLPFKLSAEVWFPSINTDNMASIFEEHRICRNLSLWQHQNPTVTGCIYGEDERRFVFNNILVGTKASARFKISNISKVPCDITATLKPVSAKDSTLTVAEYFEVEPAKTQIQTHGDVYITLIFAPQSMNKFSAILEVSIDGCCLPGRNKVLSFEVSGEGNLPLIKVEKPVVRNKRGQPVILFKKILITRTQTLPLTFANNGSLPSKIFVELFDPLGTFKLTTTSKLLTTPIAEPHIDRKTRLRTFYPVSLTVPVDESVTFDVVFRPFACRRYEAGIKVLVMENKYENIYIQLIGEGYEDDITLDNIHSVVRPNPVIEEDTPDGEDIQAAKPNVMDFGDCYIGEPKTLTFTMTNHSPTDNLRFHWHDDDRLKFSPQTGHLRAGCSKHMSVTYQSDCPESLSENPMLCSVSRITFEKPADQIADWDDRLKTVKWVDNIDSGGNQHVSIPSIQLQTRVEALKKKVVEQEPEPVYNLVEGTTREVELLVSAIADYSHYKCEETSIHFKDTLMFQTRVYHFKMFNEGLIQMDYKWHIISNSLLLGSKRSVSFSSEEKAKSSESMFLPFFIEPQRGSIMAGQKEDFTVKFCPLDLNDYESKLICSIPNLEGEDQGPVVDLKGRSLMPYCHFELHESDYLLRTSNDSAETKHNPNMQVIEFSCTGIGVKTIREFNMLNPTKLNYKFQWVCTDEADLKRPMCFRCLHPTGEIQSRKKFKAAFEFTSSELELIESSWTFNIPERNISVPFLLVGKMNDPSIIMDRAHIALNVLMGREAKETFYIVNSENIPFRFAFEKQSLQSDGFSAPLGVEPMSGKVQANSKLPISLTFIPNSEKKLNFNLICNVKSKKQPIMLNVKAQGYIVLSCVYYEHFSGERVELSDQELSLIDLGETEVNEEATRNVIVTNTGKFNFTFRWEIPDKLAKKGIVIINPSVGEVTVGKKTTCRLSFIPPNPLTLKCEVLLKISNGPTYNMRILGVGVSSSVVFSFDSHKFGSCFIHQAGMPVNSTILLITNKNTKDISVDCLYEPTKQLHHTFKAGIIKPNETMETTFTFYPREAIKYHETVTFEINSLIKRSVEFFGQGTELKVEVADPKFKMINLGARNIGDDVKKVVPIVNKSLAAIQLKVGVSRNTKALSDSYVLSVQPLDGLSLPAKGGTSNVEVIFRPRCRILQFTEEVFMEYLGLSQPLFLIKGSCLGMELTLDIENLVFGAVMLRSSSTRKLGMYNTGDINAKFRWDVKRFAPDFSITPVEGFITAGKEIVFDVTFHPQEVSSEIKYEKLECFLKGGEHPPLMLTLCGLCTPATAAKEVQNFVVSVRQKDMKNIPILNKSNSTWELKPIIDGEHWTGPTTFIIEALQTKMYPITYKPVTMTKDNKKHHGSLFFPLPDGRCLLFYLTGIAEHPKAADKITRDIPCKTSFTEVLPVKNWLKKQQRFRVRNEIVRSERVDPGVVVKGMDFIDVPANGKKNYKLTFYSYKEGSVFIKVSFTNEQTGEYLFYELYYRGTKPDVIATIELSTQVRQSVQHTIQLLNPLPHQVTFIAQTSAADILIPSSVVASPETEVDVTFEYQPLKVGKTTGRLEFVCSELGLYMYDLDLSASPAVPEKPLYFRTALGQNQVQVAKFFNYYKQRSEYACKIDNPDFSVVKTVSVTGYGTEPTVDVTFEPSELGEQRGMLTVTSPVGGEYCFPLFATCLPPKPQGPIVIKSGSPVTIMFRNVFRSITQFSFQIDSPMFSVPKTSDSIRPRRDYKLVISFNESDKNRGPVTAQLIVSCARSATGMSNVEWVYYLKGASSDK